MFVQAAGAACPMPTRSRPLRRRVEHSHQIYAGPVYRFGGPFGQPDRQDYDVPGILSGGLVPGDVRDPAAAQNGYPSIGFDKELHLIRHSARQCVKPLRRRIRRGRLGLICRGVRFGHKAF